jgi:hypothetical protein
MPAYLGTRKRSPVPDLGTWSRLHAAGTVFERAEDVPKTTGTAVFFLCGRGPAAVDSGEDCGYHGTFSCRVRSYTLTVSSRRDIYLRSPQGDRPPTPHGFSRSI